MWVAFTVHKKDVEKFTEHVVLQAQNSLKLEPGCHVFDVWRTSKKPGQVLLYEIYENQQAFLDHLSSAHYLAFDQKIKPMILSKSVVNCEIESVVSTRQLSEA